MVSKPPEEPAPLSPLAPSQPDAPDPVIDSPLGEDGGERFKRGNIVHTLMQMLPQLPKDYREAAAQAFLARGIHRLSTSLQKKFLRKRLVCSIIPSSVACFGPGSRAEVPLVGRNRRTDLVRSDRPTAGSDGKVMIVDYKTTGHRHRAQTTSP